MSVAEKQKTKKSKAMDNENVLAVYLKEINNIPLLSREDEEKYARLAAKGDINARDMLVKSNLRFVVNIAKKYRNFGIDLPDLINEGNIGLLNAIEKYDVERKYHFISYAVWWIRQAILKAIGEKSRLIRLPLNRVGEVVQIEKLKKEYLSVNGTEPEIKDIASHLSLSEEHIKEMISISREHLSFESPVASFDKDSAKMGDYIEDTMYKQPDEQLVDKSLKEEINKLLSTLSIKEADIIGHRFGLNGESPKSLKKIGDKYKLTKERIRQIEKKAIERLQRATKSHFLAAYMA